MISIEHHNSTSSAAVNIKVHDICTLKGFYREILDVLLSYANNYTEIFPSREKIAYQVGCSLHHVDKVISKLIDLGAIKKINRGYLNTNKYIIADIFYFAEIREQLAKFYSSFKVWGMASLMRATALFRKNESLLNGILFIRFKLLTFEREWSCHDDIDLINKNKNLPKRGNASDMENNESQFALSINNVMQKVKTCEATNTNQVHKPYKNEIIECKNYQLTDIINNTNTHTLFNTDKDADYPFGRKTYNNRKSYYNGQNTGQGQRMGNRNQEQYEYDMKRVTTPKQDSYYSKSPLFNQPTSKEMKSKEYTQEQVKANQESLKKIEEAKQKPAFFSFAMDILKIIKEKEARE
jgi:hypothetical protein